MHSPLDLSVATWHFKRAARGPVGSPYSVWQPHLETIDVCDANAAGAQKHLGSLDPRLDTWIPAVRAVPNDPFVLLQDLGIIPDPALGLNEDLVQWIGETDWVFRCIFKTPADLAAGHSLDLLVEKLDTFATIWLNDKQIHSSQNGFMSYRIRLSEHARKKKGDGNVLIFHFASAFREGRKLELQHGKRSCWNGDSSRVYVRKPQYHYGWDWGPTLLTCGIVGVPSLHSYTYRLDDVSIQTSNNNDGKLLISSGIFGPKGLLSIAMLQTLQDDCQIKVEVKLGDEYWEYTHGVEDSDGIFSSRYEIIGQKDQEKHGEVLDNPQCLVTAARLYVAVALPVVRRWHLGTQAQDTLYTVRLTLLDQSSISEVVLDTIERRVGFRKIELIEEPFPSQPGSSFYFRINDQPVFIGGSNWIPASSHPSTMTKQDYRELLTLLVQGGQNAIRIWGGGYYENDDFYDICDELGILVWQDFMFACASYPAELAAFRENVEKEAIHAVKRLAHHPCLALFAGNNEDYCIAEADKLDWEPTNKNPEDWLSGTFPARYIYEKILPEVVKRYSHVAYHPGSPWNTGSDTSDPTRGDNHQWNVWHKTQQAYQDWDKLGGRFVSEFGMHALPDRRTIDSFTGSKAEDRHPQSRVMEMHNKADGGITRLSHYMVSNLKYTMDLDNYIYASQLMQAECLSTAYRSWRREWRGEGRRYCGGALVWQLNDVYPCVSWSIVDFYKRPKLAYYAIKRVLQPLTINLKRVKKTTYPDPMSTRRIEEHFLHVWTSNSTSKTYAMKVEISTVDIATGKSKTICMPHLAEANCSTEVETIKMDGLSEQDVVMVARLFIEEKVEAETFSWPDPLRFIKPNNATVTFTLDKDSLLTVRTDRPVKGVTFSFDSDVIMEDNGFDMVAGDARVIKVSQIPGRQTPKTIRKPTCRWYNQM